MASTGTNSNEYAPQWWWIRCGIRDSDHAKEYILKYGVPKFKYDPDGDIPPEYCESDTESECEDKPTWWSQHGITNSVEADEFEDRYVKSDDSF